MGLSGSAGRGALPDLQDPRLRAGLQVSQSLRARKAERTGAPGAARAPGGAHSAVGLASTLRPASPPLPQHCPGSRTALQLQRAAGTSPWAWSPSLSRGVRGTSVHRDPLTSPVSMSKGFCHFPSEGLPSSQRRMLRLELAGRAGGKARGLALVSGSVSAKW